MHAPAKHVEKSLSVVANVAWTIFAGLNRVRPAPAATPLWAGEPPPRSTLKTTPPLGVPRTTNSLCPGCVREARQAILDGQLPLDALRTGHVGEIPARIEERDGRIVMEKDCPVHGHFEDVLSVDPAFFRHLEAVFPGRDMRTAGDAGLHDHGPSAIRYGRGAVLTVDLTNRCNMMCDPCFMDANQVGFVHELGWDEITTVLDNAIRVTPRRQMSVQFSGGEPTLSPHFLDAVRYARGLGYSSVQAATNGIAFATSKDFAARAAEAGLRFAYLQFDGIGNAANAHRHVGNLFDVKLQAIEHLHAAGIDIVPVITLVNGVNNEQVGRIIRFALDNPTKISCLSFQPVSFTGRDEAITPERRAAQRYTLSHLAHDVRSQLGLGEPARDWFPISFMGSFTDWADQVHGPTATWGNLNCGCHPDCGAGMAVMVDKVTREAVPVSSFLRAEQLARDVAAVTDGGRGRLASMLGMALALLRNYDPYAAPSHFRFVDLLRKFDKTFGATADADDTYGRVGAARTRADIDKRRADRWNFLFIAGMWFQDLFTYDFRRTEMCIIPYATQMGEISFCAYNSGIGWRQILEKMHMTATLTQWYAAHGRHEIFAGDREVPLTDTAHSLVLDEAAVGESAQTDLDRRGIARTARDERLAARATARAAAPAPPAEMARLYRQHVLREPPLLQIQGLTGRDRPHDVAAAAPPTPR